MKTKGRQSSSVVDLRGRNHMYLTPKNEGYAKPVDLKTKFDLEKGLTNAKKAISDSRKKQGRVRKK